MTDQHPLTDDFCDRIADCGEKDNMRSAADWQLEQVTKWLKKHLDERYIDVWIMEGVDLDPGIDVERVIDDLKKAMRPTQEEN